jgi:hypothetical protein
MQQTDTVLLPTANPLSSTQAETQISVSCVGLEMELDGF